MRLPLLFLLLIPAALAQKPQTTDLVRDRFEPIRYEDQRIDGFLGERLRINLERRLLNIEEQTLLEGFQSRPGKHPWIGEHAGKYLHAAANTWRLTKNEALRAQMTRMALALIETQKEDGYLGTYTDDQRWTSWDVWVHKYNLIGLLAYYEISGDERALEAASKVGLLLHREFVTRKRDVVASSTHVGMAASSVLEPLCQLYRYSGDYRHLDAALAMVKSWEQPNGPKLISSLLSHGDVHRTANAKAYEMMSDLVGLLELYRITGTPDYLEAPRRAALDIAARRRFITGTTSNHEHFQADNLFRAEPSNDVGEGCATVTWMQLNWHLLRLTGDERYAAELERTIFNHLLAAQEPATGDVCYFTPLNGGKSPRRDVNCCRSSVPRGISLIPQAVWGAEGEAVKLLLYTPGRATVNGLILTAETDFPASGRVRLTVTSLARGQRVPILLRVPDWTRSFTARLGDETLTGKPGTFLRVERAWGVEEVIEVDMEMTVQVHDGGPAYPHHASIQRGPAVMALDRAANPAVPHLFRTALNSLNEPGDGLTIPGQTWRGGKIERPPLRLIPFADAADYRVWLYKPGHLPAGPVSRAAFGRELAQRRTYAAQGSYVDERTDTWRLQTPREPAGGEVTLGVELREPGPVARIAVVAGEGGAGFRAPGPAIEIQRAAGGDWEPAGQLAGRLANAGERLELRLLAPVHAHAIRIRGEAGAEGVSIAEIEAWPE
jgi:uncharacterized protein